MKIISALLDLVVQFCWPAIALLMGVIAFYQPSPWLAGLGWLCLSVAWIVIELQQKTIGRMGRSRRLHIRFLNGPNKVELRGAPPRSPYHSRGAQS